MSILSGPEIVRVRNNTVKQAAGEQVPSLPRITIEPFNRELAGSNSYDVHLSHQMKVYALKQTIDAHPELFDLPLYQIEKEETYYWYTETYKQAPDHVDALNPPKTVEFVIPETGFMIYPGVLYLGATVERTLAEGLVPWLDGRSSTGRLGISLHCTAGRGDDDWAGRWTLEITAVAHPVMIYPNMRLAQITYFTLEGERKKYAGRYANQDTPTESKLHEEVQGLPPVLTQSK